MATGTATVTAKTGPAQQLTTQVFTNVTAFNSNLANSTLTIDHSTGRTIVDLSGVTTFTVSISDTVYTITIS